MTGQRLLLTGLSIAIIGAAAFSGDAEARCRCRNGYGNSGWGGRQATGYAYSNYNNGSTSYASAPQVAPTNAATVNTVVPNQQPSVAPTNQPVIQTNGTYAADKPVYTAPVNAPAPRQVIAPAPVQVEQVQKNSSPDPDNEGRNASKIPGTAPTKAPAPAADAIPR